MKMRIKSLFAAVFVLLLGIFVLSGCEKPTGSPAETKEPKAEKVVIFENGQMRFSVVRQDTDDKMLIDASVRLRKALEEVSGTEITLGNDFVRPGEAPPEDTPEILIGITNRAASKAAYEALGSEGLHYSITFDGKKLILTATDAYGIDEVLNVFLEKCLSETVNGSLSLPVGLDIRGEYRMPVSVTLEKLLGVKLDFDYDNGCCSADLADCREIYQGDLYYIDVYDMCMNILKRDSVLAYDTELAVSVLQGLANRESPSLVVRSRPQTNGNADQWVDGIEPDLYWLYIYSQPGQYLSGANLRLIPWKANGELDAVKELFTALASSYKGLVVWDSDLPATMPVACTVAGVEDLIPVRYDTGKNSLYTLFTEKMGLEVKVNLVGKFTGKKGTVIPDTAIPSTGSAKNDAYLWAKDQYLDAGLTSAEYICLTRDAASYSADKLSYQAPHNTGVNGYDWPISQKAFFFSLSGTGRGAPEDEPDQPAGTDYDTFNQILQSQYDRADGGFYQVCGWPQVGDGVSDATATEWYTTELLSSYHGVIEMMAGGFSASGNSSLYLGLPEITYRQTAKPQETDIDDDTICVMFYMGDYDSVAWLHNVIPVVWESEGRGKLPLAWGISGMQGKRAGYIYNYLYQTATPNDYFVAVNNGAGYLNPQFLIPANTDKKYAGKTIPDGLDAWVSLCTGLYDKYDLTATPFFIPNFLQDLSAKSSLTRVLKAYSEFSPDGFGWYHWSDDGLRNIGGTPLVTSFAGENNLATGEAVYQNLVKFLTNSSYLKREKNMILIREVIVDPAAIERAVERVRDEYPKINFEVVDPYTFFSVAADRMG